MEKLSTSVRQAIVSTKTYMDIEDDVFDILFSTREHGDVSNETPSIVDIKEAQRVQNILQKNFPELKITISTTDEWTNLCVQKPKPIEYKYEYRLYEQGKTDRMSSAGGDYFETFEELVASLENPYVGGDSSSYGLKCVDWKTIKTELDNITEYPKDLFTGWHRSKLLLVAKVGEFGNKKSRDVYVSKKRSDQ
jgi:hypothetical protein